jgi:hypothetical protein
MPSKALLSWTGDLTGRAITVTILNTTSRLKKIAYNRLQAPLL